jgi:hypothetical protein
VDQGLVESHADPVFSEPDDVATHMHRIGAECQDEMFRDASETGYIECRPVMDRSRTKQVIALPSNSIVAAFNTRFLGAARRSSIKTKYRRNTYKLMKSSDCETPLMRCSGRQRRLSFSLKAKQALANQCEALAGSEYVRQGTDRK